MSVALSLHPEDALTLAVDAVRPKTMVRTSSGVQSSTRIAPNRLESRIAAKIRLRKALANTRTSNVDFARALRVDEKMIRNWLDVEHLAVPGEGDIEAGSREVWREYLRLALEELDAAPAMCPKSAMLTLVGKVGELASEVAVATSDGRIDEAEADAIERIASHVHKTFASVLASIRRRP